MSNTIRLNLRQKVAKTDVSLNPSLPVPVSAELLSPVGSRRVCSVCVHNTSSYCCPTCFAPYCSLKCYQSHNLECTEAFFKQKIQESKEFDESIDCFEKPDKHTAMADILNSPIDSGVQDMDDDLIEIAQRLHESEFDIHQLNDDERKLLYESVSSRKNRLNMKMSSEDWMPWYLGGNQRILSKFDIEETLPYRWSGAAIDLHILLIKNLLNSRSIKPLPNIQTEHQYHYLNIFISYTILVRMYHDEIDIHRSEFVHYFMLLTGIDDTKFRPQSIHEIVERVSHLWSTIPGVQVLNKSRLAAIFKDVSRLISLPEYSRLCLLDCWDLTKSPRKTFTDLSSFSTTFEEFYNVFSKPISAKEDSFKEQTVCRKIYFLYLISCMERHVNANITRLEDDKYENLLKSLSQSVDDYVSYYLSGDGS